MFDFLKDLSTKQFVLVVLIAVGAPLATAIVGYAVRGCGAARDAERYQEAIKAFEAESSRVLHEVTSTYIQVQQTVKASQDTQRLRDERAEDHHAETLQAIDDKLNERFAAIQDWYEAELVRRQEVIRAELPNAADDPDAVGKLFLDIFGPGPGCP